MDEFEEMPPCLEPSNFTWFASYTKAMEMLPADKQAEFAIGVIRYGAYGNEPFFEYPLDFAFELIRPNIDNSRKWSQMGKKGNEKRWGNKNVDNS